METDIRRYVVHTNFSDWQPLVEEGVDTKGIWVKVLRYVEIEKRAPSILLKFDPGARYPYHNHPGGEELFVLEGSCIIEGATLYPGDYLYTPVNFKHAVESTTGCVVLFMIPKEVEILK